MSFFQRLRTAWHILFHRSEPDEETHKAFHPVVMTPLPLPELHEVETPFLRNMPRFTDERPLYRWPVLHERRDTDELE